MALNDDQDTDVKF